MFRRALPEADAYFVLQEFGTSNHVRVLKTLRSENRWHHRGDGGVEHRTKLDLAEVFTPRSESWRQAVLNRGGIVFRQALTLVTGGR